MADRAGWPSGACELLECANCGQITFHGESAPPPDTGAYERWAQAVWPEAQTMRTIWGFKLWCSHRCRWEWLRHREQEQFIETGWMQRHRRDMRERLIHSGLG